MLDTILADLRAQPSRTGSLIVTLYGDAIAPRGGALWLGSMLALFGAMEVREGVVRTAVSRLAAEGWLARSRVGRYSFYRLDARGERESRAAVPRIYGGVATTAWGGQLRLVLLESSPVREVRRLELATAGYGAAAPGLMIAPATHPAPAEAAGSLLMTAQADPTTLRALARRAWPLDDLAARYRKFLDAVAGDPPTEAPLAAMVARLVLVHEWRRVVLRDPMLPAAMLPDDWPGPAARARVSALYEALHPASERWLDAYGRTEQGPLPPAHAARHRFML